MKKKDSENYLEKIPSRPEEIKWDADEEGSVTLSIENKGIMKRITQVILRKPKTSYIHLDEMGSFVWQLMDGEKNLTEIGISVKEHFGEKSEPVYPRLAEYFRILDSYGFVKWECR